jgi:hypothetical protein
VNTVGLVCIFRILICISTSLVAGPPQSTADLEAAVASGHLSYMMTEPEEVIALFGAPEKTEELKEGGGIVQLFHYPETMIAFGKSRDSQAPFALLAVEFKGRRLDIGQNRLITPRNQKDLAKLHPVAGFENVSLVKLDLSNESEFVDRMPFSSATEWPPAKQLPSGFDPGQGIRKLHQESVDGRGIAIAIIDQPLLREHVEYRDAVVRYEPIGVDGMPPQYHASGVASIAAGKNRGVAPGARLTFFAVPMWKRDNQHYIAALKNLLDLNRTAPEGDRIRAVSISDGMFRHNEHYEEWVSVLKEAEESGVFVVTCDEESWAVGTLRRVPEGDPDDPEAYRKGKYTQQHDVLRVPAGNMTRASHMGPEVYAFDREGGRSWTAPYIAGLAALACQVKPRVSPAEIKAALLTTATATSAGPVINPRGFLAEIQKQRK